MTTKTAVKEKPIEYQCPFCSKCMTENSGGSWWPDGSPNGVLCQVCWDAEYDKTWWEHLPFWNGLSGRSNE